MGAKIEIGNARKLRVARRRIAQQRARNTLVMYTRGSLMLCSYSRALASARSSALAYRAQLNVCTRGYAAKVEPKAEPVEKKEKVIREKEQKDPSKFYLNREFNAPLPETTTSSISQVELKKLMESGEQYVLIDLRTEKEIELAGDPAIPTSVKMPINPITHLNSYKPPKVKVDPKAKGKGAKAAKQAKVAASKAVPPKEEVTQRDLFRPIYRMTAATWLQTYNFPKIGLNDNVIFYSSSNVRSSSVVNSAMKLGYKNVKILEGGSRVWNKYYNILANQ